jgi:hypothetical protein
VYERGSERFTYGPMGSRVECPECKKLVHVGTGVYYKISTRTVFRRVSRSETYLKQARIKNTPHLYYGIGDLMAIAKRKQQQVDEFRIARLNDSRKLRVNVNVCAQSERRYVSK